ncbi:flagellar biosynthetic protein FliO [Bacillus sp. HMF5848]|uniref:flagellar biosynthetic protein FliO n=1 Tax=Bacillus sp. HMF5848 TaxID=2495421 RepID=UPI000F77202C|nr:flagellar biosynthetic protein FliO [Bacillus sp. HMF5848]RSK27038.1 flagellar biosynthetic protein FliO [Bacillus sp. HMF5848]
MFKRVIILCILICTSLIAPLLPSVQAEQPASVEDWLNDSSHENDEKGTPSSTDKAEKVTDTIDSSPTVNAWDFVKMLFATAFVIGLIYFTFRFINKRNKVFSGAKYIENIGGTSLGANRSVQLIKVGDEILVVGVGESITLLKEIHANDEVSAIIEQHNNGLDQLIQRSDIFNRIFKDKKKNENKGTGDFQSVLNQQLKDLSDGRKKLLRELEKERDTHHD